MNHDRYRVPPDGSARLRNYDPDATGSFTSKEEAAEKLAADVKKLAALQDILYAQNTYGLLVILQALDAAGKDSVVKHVMSGVNPQGCSVVSFKAPSAEELDHDFLWRCQRHVPERGRIGIFNRSYYEEVLVVRVHPEYLDREHLPPEERGKQLWKHRFEDINAYERYLDRNGIKILKFYLHLSRKEQKERFLDRIRESDKNWKFSLDDLAVRADWDRYQEAYEEMLNATSTPWAPWYVIPADHKWFTRAAVADVIVDRLRALDLRYPDVSAEQRDALRRAEQQLLHE
jgi:PPK2 family polyphosphate:nucleotide phosphotransferase